MKLLVNVHLPQVKTLDMYNNNCIGFIGIYLMHNGVCYPNGSYFHDANINGVSNSIMCVLPGSTLNGGEWVAPSGSSVDCSTNPIRCNAVSSPATISLYNKGNIASSDYWSRRIYAWARAKHFGCHSVCLS